MAEKSTKSKYYTRKKTIEGVEYTAQFNGLSAALDATDEAQGAGGGVSTKKLTAYVLDNVIVDPAGLTPDDFDSMDTLTAVVKWGSEVMRGKFRNSDDKGGAEKQG